MVDTTKVWKKFDKTLVQIQRLKAVLENPDLLSHNHVLATFSTLIQNLQKSARLLGHSDEAINDLCTGLFPNIPKHKDLKGNKKYKNINRVNPKINFKRLLIKPKKESEICID